MKGSPSLESPNRSWRIRLRFSQMIRATIAGVGAIDTIVFGLLSVVLLPGWVWLSQRALTLPEFGWAALGVLLLQLVLTAVFAWRALRYLPPVDFAKVTIGGQAAPDILQHTAYEIWKICFQLRTSRHLRRLVSTLPECPDWGKADAADLEELKRCLQRHQLRCTEDLARLKKLVIRQQVDLQRVGAMKQIAAAEFKAPARRLCDHAFEFSPSMYQSRTEKYVRNWEELLASASTLPGSGPLVPRLKGLLEENRKVLRQIERRIRYQLQIIRFTSLLPAVHAFSSEHSSSGSIRDYSRAITQVVVEDQRRNSQRALSSPGPRLNLCDEQLRFLYFKQRVHPGFDLHLSCIRVCELTLESLRAAQNLCSGEERQQRLGRLNDQLQVLRKLHDPSRRTALREVSEDDLPRVSDSLRSLAADIDWSIELARQAICDRFLEFYARWQAMNSPPRPTFILTHGYSKTVRNALMKLNNSLGPGPPRPRVFVMSSGSEESFDTRLMTHEVRQAGFADVAWGDERLFLSLLGRETKLLVLLGAECFDQSLRVIHPRGMTLERAELRRLARRYQMDVKVVVLAEEYKYEQDLLDIPQFYQHHLDRVSLYEPKLVDYVISDQKIRP